MRRSSAGLARRGFCCALLAACLSGGCSVYPVRESVRPAVAGGEAFSLSVDGVEMEHRWWRALGDERLIETIEAALSENLDVQQARLRIEQSAALARRAASRLPPALDFGAGAEREWPDKGVNHNDRLTGELRLSWEVDLWGRLSSAREAARQETVAAREDLQATALLLSAAVADAYFGIVEQRLQLALLDEQIEVGQTLLGLIELRFGQGQA